MVVRRNARIQATGRTVGRRAGAALHTVVEKGTWNTQDEQGRRQGCPDTLVLVQGNCVAVALVLGTPLSPPRSRLFSGGHCWAAAVGYRGQHPGDKARHAGALSYTAVFWALGRVLFPCW